jgi:hypothetical protein
MHHDFNWPNSSVTPIVPSLDGATPDQAYFKMLPRRAAA